MTAFRFSSACGPTGGQRQRKQTKRQCAAASTGRSSEQRQRQQTERACVLLSNSSVGRRLVAPRELLRLSSEDVVQRACGAADTRTYRLDDLAIRHQCLRQQRLELRGLVGHDPAAVRRGLLLHLPPSASADRAQRRAAEKIGAEEEGACLFSSHVASSSFHRIAFHRDGTSAHECGPACRHRCCRCSCCCWRAPP